MNVAFVHRPPAAGAALPLPALSPPAAEAASRAYAWRRAFEFECGGECGSECSSKRRTVRWDYTARLAPGTPRHYRFRFGPAAGWLLLEPRAERALIGDGADDAVPDVIRCALLADALAPLAAALEQATRQTLTLAAPEPGEALPATAQASGEPTDDASPLRFVLGVPDGTWHAHGALLFDDPRYLMLACPGAPPLPALDARDFDTLPVPLAFRIGSTRLTQREFASLRHGDIIAIEQWKPSGAGLVCRAATPGARGLVLDARVVGARITIDHIQTSEAPSMNASSPPEPPTDGTQGNAGGAHTGVLDALEVDASFELERRTLTLAQLKAMQPGFVIELDQPLNQSVIRILANGMEVGTGHLIAVGNKLGVRVSALGGDARSADPERDDG